MKRKNAADYVYACSITVNRDVAYFTKSYGILWINKFTYRTI